MRIFEKETLCTAHLMDLSGNQTIYAHAHATFSRGIDLPLMEKC